MKNQTVSSQKKSNKNRYLLAGIGVSSALVMARPIIPAAVYAAVNTYDWTEHNDLDFNDGENTTAAISADGNSLITAVFDGGEDMGEGQDYSPLYVSHDYGVSWTDVASAADENVRNWWTGVDVSNDGQTMVAVSDESRVFGESWAPGKVVLSQDGGTSWDDITPIGGEYWQQVALSGDGSTIAFANGYNDNISTYDVDGLSWDTHEVDTEEHLYDIGSLSISDNGEKLLVGAGGSGSEWDVFMSQNGGVDWENISPVAGEDGGKFAATAMSADGSKIAAATFYQDEGDEDAVFISNNNGDTWTDVTPEHDDWNPWLSVAMSDDGESLAVLGLNYGGEDYDTYVSNDAGASWNEEDPSNDVSTNYGDPWQPSNVDLNSTGSRVIVASVDAVYTGYNASVDVIDDSDDESSVTMTDAEGGKTVTLTTPDGTTITCHEAVKESGLAAKDGAYTYPLGLVDFCFSGADADNEVSLVFVTDLKPNQVVVRKYNTANGSYATISDATVTETTYSGQHALQVTYNIVDNGPLDLDPDTGEVADPVGIATADVAAPNTGMAPQQKTNAAITTLLTSVALTSGLLIGSARRVAERFGSRRK